MHPERRAPRKAVNRILSIQIGPNNHAIVQNISDEGLGFHALNPVTDTGTIRFSFTENGQRVEASGDLAWIDEAKKTGGLSLISLPPASRERLRSWVNEPATKPQAASVPTSTNERPGGIPFPGPDPSVARTGSPPHVPPPDQTTRQADFRTDIPADTRADTPGFALFEDPPQAERYEWDQEMLYPGSKGKFFRGFVTGVIVTAIVGAILLFAFGDPSKIFHAPDQTKIDTAPAPQVPPVTLPSETAPPPLVSSTAPSSESPVLPAPTGLLPESPVEPKTNSADALSAITPRATEKRAQPLAPALPPPKTGDNGDAALAIAQRYLGGKSGPASREAAARFLWAAVDKGNVTAEITLADLYSRGDGVTKNCTQARVLLQAAEGKGLDGASQELAQIIRRTCR